MHKGILIALGLVAALGLIYIVTRSGPDAPDRSGERDVTAASASQPDAPGAMPAETPEIASASPETSPPANAPPAKTRTAPLGPDPRVDNVDGKVFLNDPITVTRNLHSDTTSPMDDVSAVGTALRYYQLVFKENPVGSLNMEIISQLTGNNPKGIVVIPPDHPDINGAGELVDRWGNPYFFHGLTRTAMDVWSAGPDGKFGSVDDVKLGVDEEFGEELGLVIDP